jgi:hypothetical protein
MLSREEWLHIATNFVFETGFTNLQFVGLASLARESSDHMFDQGWINRWHPLAARAVHAFAPLFEDTSERTALDRYYRDYLRSMNLEVPC